MSAQRTWLNYGQHLDGIREASWFPCAKFSFSYTPKSGKLQICFEKKVVVRKLIASTSELCEIKDEHCMVHQVRKLAELEALGQDRPHWAQIMLKKRRKTLIVCQACHDAIHDRCISDTLLRR